MDFVVLNELLNLFSDICFLVELIFLCVSCFVRSCTFCFCVCYLFCQVKSEICIRMNRVEADEIEKKSIWLAAFCMWIYFLFLDLSQVYFKWKSEFLLLSMKHKQKPPETQSQLSWMIEKKKRIDSSRSSNWKKVIQWEEI